MPDRCPTPGPSTFAGSFDSTVADTRSSAYVRRSPSVRNASHPVFATCDTASFTYHCVAGSAMFGGSNTGSAIYGTGEAGHAMDSTRDASSVFHASSDMGYSTGGGMGYGDGVPQCLIIH